MTRLRILYVSPCRPVVNGVGAQMRSHVAAAAMAELGDVYFLEVPASSGAPEVECTYALFAGTLNGQALLARRPDLWLSYTRLGLWGRLTRRAWITAGSIQRISNLQTEHLVAVTREAFGDARFDVVFVFQAHAGAFVLDAVPHWLAPKGVSILDWDAAERPGAKAQYLAKPGGKRLSSRLGGMLNDWKLAAMERKLLRGFSVAVCASQYDVDYFESKSHGGKVSAIPNCVNLPPMDMLTESPGKQPHVLFVGFSQLLAESRGSLDVLARYLARSACAL